MIKAMFDFALDRFTEQELGVTEILLDTRNSTLFQQSLNIMKILLANNRLRVIFVGSIGNNVLYESLKECDPESIRSMPTDGGYTAEFIVVDGTGYLASKVEADSELDCSLTSNSPTRLCFANQGKATVLQSCFYKIWQKIAE